MPLWNKLTISASNAKWRRSEIFDPSRNDNHTSRWCPPSLCPHKPSDERGATQWSLRVTGVASTTGSLIITQSICRLGSGCIVGPAVPWVRPVSLSRSESVTIAVQASDCCDGTAPEAYLSSGCTSSSALTTHIREVVRSVLQEIDTCPGGTMCKN